MMFLILLIGNICSRVFLYMEVVGFIIFVLLMFIGNFGVIFDIVILILY